MEDLMADSHGGRSGEARRAARQAGGGRCGWREAAVLHGEWMGGGERRRDDLAGGRSPCCMAPTRLEGGGGAGRQEIIKGIQIITI
ncbi:hypothetical protein GQ55_1G177800 [Panicum hallii var. hallii]|uniref:Uncharacterized protein n=1 Tax=Panicum hallii var. hallii TaxID=1504633 RepID=A0A2T7F5Z8_9POAL|nr:hypothetical protein GQ55_1G177800 [Panicum hallii var. hallii]